MVTGASILMLSTRAWSSLDNWEGCSWEASLLQAIKARVTITKKRYFISVLFKSEKSVPSKKQEVGQKGVVWRLYFFETLRLSTKIYYSLAHNIFYNKKKMYYTASFYLKLSL